MAPHKVFAWFETEVLSWRTVSSVVRGLIIQLLALFLFNCVITFAPFTPIRWITSNLGVFLTPSSWFYDFLIVACFSGLSLLQAREFQMVTSVPGNRLSSIKQLVQPQVLISLLAHIVAGGLVLRCLLGLQGGPYSSLTIHCKEGQISTTCLNEGHVFLVMSGCYLGLCLWLDFHFRNGNVIEFPLLLLESGNAQLIRSVSPILRTSFVQVASDLKLFYFAYLVSGYRIENFLARLFGIELFGTISQRSWGSTVYFHLWLLLSCVAILTLVSFAVRVMKKILAINFTKPVRFPDEESLVEAMSKSLELIGHHACLDFATLAAAEKERRAEFFEISQPGGHPHKWNLLSGRCLVMFEEFLKKLNESSQALRASHQAALAKHQEEEEARRKFVVGPSRPAEPHSGVQDIAAGVPSLLSGVQKQTNLISKVLGVLADKIQKNPLVGSSPDSALRTVFAQSQPIIWAVEGLSHLIAASTEEDRYGVVQKDLPKILAALLTLQQTVDRQKGMASSSARKNRCECRDQQLKYELRAAIKTALYRITIKFGDHLEAVPVPPEFEKRISNFRQFMEG